MPVYQLSGRNLQVFSARLQDPAYDPAPVMAPVSETASVLIAWLALSQ